METAGASVLILKNYGDIRIKLAAVMDESGIARNQLAAAVGTRLEVIDRWYKGGVEKLDLDILARVCFVLECRVEDILEYQKINKRRRGPFKPRPDALPAPKRFQANRLSFP